MNDNPINAKNFMEFFQNQLGVTFVDIATGKNALDLILEQGEASAVERLCKTCEYCKCGDGVFAHVEDMICVNPKSENLGEFILSDDRCVLWEQLNNSNFNPSNSTGLEEANQ
jgi:hypothetical protein